MTNSIAFQMQPFYYTMKEFYRLSCCAGSEDIEPPLGEGLDFTFINGRSILPTELKRQVLQAVLSARSKFDEYFDLFKKNDIYFVASFLDPTSRYDVFDQLMVENGSDSHLKRVELYVKSFLGRCKPAKVYSIDSLSSRKAQSSVKKVSKLPLIYQRRTTTIDTLTLSRNKALEEWDGYKRESQIQSDCVIDALKWWHSKRSIYPNLFRLVLPLLFEN